MTLRDIDTDQLDLRSDARNIDAAKVEALAESIADTGLINPIRVRAGADGRFEVIAGAHRLAAHKILGLAEVPAILVNDDDLHAELAMIDENLIRAELTPVDRARQTARRKAIYEELFPETVAGVAGGKARQGTAGDKLSFAEDTAAKTGRDARSIQRDASRGARVSDDVLDMIRSTPLNTGLFLDRLKNLTPADQKRVVKDELARLSAEAVEKRRAKAEAKKERRAEREQTLAAKQTSLPDKRYGVIYADPEWRFEPYSRESGMDRAADNHYPTSALDAITSRPVGDIAADDCVLFLWATAPMLPQALEVLAAWGFTYKSQVIWRKADIESRGADPAKVDRGRYSTSLVLGTGYWFRNAHEILLVGTRGNVPAPAMGDQFPSIIDAAPLKHSEKPERFAELIEAYFPNLPKIELNARTRRDGWDCWGLEAPDLDAHPTPAVSADPPHRGDAHHPSSPALRAPQDEGGTDGLSPSHAAAAAWDLARTFMAANPPNINGAIAALYAVNAPLDDICAFTGLPNPNSVKQRAKRMKLGDRDRQRRAVAAANRRRKKEAN